MKMLFTLYRLRNQMLSLFAPSHIAQTMATAFLKPKRSEVKEWELKAEFKGERFHLTDEISAIRWSAPSHLANQKQILLVHGWESRATHMFGLVDGLLVQGYQVIGVDMPGHGRSLGRSSNAHLFAQTLLLAQDKLGPFSVIIGHSMGASATSIAVSNGVKADKLVLISGPSSIERSIRHVTRSLGFNRRTSDLFIQNVSQIVGVPFQQLDATQLLKECHIPTLLIHDEADKEVLASESKQLAQVLQNAHLMITQGFGHRQILKAQKVQQAITDFVANERLIAPKVNR